MLLVDVFHDRLADLERVHSRDDDVRRRSHSQDALRDLITAPVFGPQNGVTIAPGRALEAFIGAGVEVHSLSAAILLFKPLERDGLDHKGRVPVRGVRRHGVGIFKHAHRISDAADHNVFVEAVVGGVFEIDAEIAEPTTYGAVQRVVISHVRVGVVLDMPDQAVEHLGGVQVGLIIGRAGLDRRAVLARVVDHLTDDGREAVERQSRAAVIDPFPLYVRRPLLVQPSEAEVVKPRLTVLRRLARVGALVEGVLGLFDDVVVRGQSGQPPDAKRRFRRTGLAGPDADTSIAPAWRAADCEAAARGTATR